MEKSRKYQGIVLLEILGTLVLFFSVSTVDFFPCSCCCTSAAPRRSIASWETCTHCRHTWMSCAPCATTRGLTPSIQRRRTSYCHMTSSLDWSVDCCSFCFHFVQARLVIHQSAVRLLLFMFIAPCCWPFLFNFLVPLPFVRLSSGSPSILAVLFLVSCNLLGYLCPIFVVISRLSFWPCVQPISTGS